MATAYRKARGVSPIDCVCLVCWAVPGMPCTGASGRILKHPHLWRAHFARDESLDDQ